MMNYNELAKDLINELEDLPKDEWVNSVGEFLSSTIDEAIEEFIELRKDKLAMDDNFTDYIVSYVMED